MLGNVPNPGGSEREGAQAAGVMGTEFKKQIIASTSLGRVVQPEDIGRVAAFLAADDAGGLMGEIILRSGGEENEFRTKTCGEARGGERESKRGGPAFPIFN